ncbi:MAG TPA: class I SAM-dependent methyltransferase [Anaerolineae bacterium]
MAEHNALYQRAFYYDIALSRDVSREVDFIHAVYRRVTGSNLQSILEIACGPGYHARAFARRGVQAIGLDLQPDMIAFARDKAQAEGLQITWLAADMRHFELPAPVNAAICLFDALDALTRNEDLVQHLCHVAASLTPNGLYIVDLTHPRDVSLTHYGDFRYGGERDGIRVEITWATTEPKIDLVKGIAYTGLEIAIDDNGREIVIQDSAAERLFVPQEIQLLADLSAAFKVVGWYGDFDLNQPLDMSLQSKRMIAVLQKKAEGSQNG